MMKRLEDIGRNEQIFAGGQWWHSWNFSSSEGTTGRVLGWEVIKDHRVIAYLARGETALTRCALPESLVATQSKTAVNTPQALRAAAGVIKELSVIERGEAAHHSLIRELQDLVAAIGLESLAVKASAVKVVKQLEGAAN
tara:strand:+ start:1137 stop:1556 length:420 start_codon:yes stop_codon:yes gene_type:complete